MKMLAILVLFLLPGCQTLGIPTPWPTMEDVEHGDATVLASADTRAMERDVALEVAVEQVVGVDVPHTPADPLKPPAPVSGIPGGVGWPELLVTAAVIFLSRGLPSKGPIPRMVHGLATAVRRKPKEKAPVT